MLKTIRNGSQGVDVALLQAKLSKDPQIPSITVDGAFGPKTESALRRYQSNHRSLTSDGVAGPKTWGTFPFITEIRHNVTLRAQTGTMGCWSAAAGMVTGQPMSYGPGSARTGTGGGLRPSLANVETFARELGWRLHTHQSAPAGHAILDAMRRNPVWIAFEGMHFKHAVVFSAVLSDGTDDGTVFEVKDPWPVGRGTSYATGYANRRVTLRSSADRPQAIVAFVLGP